MKDDEVKTYFLQWVAGSKCPWYVLEQYYSENNRRLPAVRDPSATATGKSPSPTGQEATSSATGQGEREPEEALEKKAEEDGVADTEDGEESAQERLDPKGNVAEVS